MDVGAQLPHTGGWLQGKSRLLRLAWPRQKLLGRAADLRVFIIAIGAGRKGEDGKGGEENRTCFHTTILGGFGARGKHAARLSAHLSAGWV